MSDTHPEFEEEQRFLARTVDAIDRAFEELKGRSYEGSASNFGNRMLNLTIRADTLEQLEEYSHRAPYFGRLDFTGERGADSAYFGFAHLPLPHGRILDWRCDLYSLYVGTNARQQSYRVKATGREHRVELLLKRRLDIQGRHLRDLTDLIDRRATDSMPIVAAAPLVPAETPPAAAPPPAAVPPATGAPDMPVLEEDVRDDAFLIRQLYSRGDPRLQDIVETIQAQQDAIIRLPLEELLVLHGVAGSGKTSIAYHRLAYLMYPEHGYGLRPADVLIVGPNRTFLTYVRDLLPSLGVSSIAQRTFQDWAWNRMRLRNKALPAAPEFRDVVETLLEDADASPEVRAAAQAAARLKGSLRFRQLIDRYAQRLLETPTLPTETVVIPGHLEGRALNMPITVPELETMWNEVRGEDGTQDERRERFLRRAARQPGIWFATIFGEPTQRDKGFLLQMSKAVRDRLGRAWARPNLMKSYGALFAPETLDELGHDLFSAEERRLLARVSDQIDGNPPAEVAEESVGPEEAVPVRLAIDVVDVAGLLLLNDRLYGNRSARYRHVVLDEAQDFSPLQVQLLLDACPSGSMTIVGDTAQGIYAYRGIEDWADLADAFPADQVRRELIRQNYRSTREIVAFTNAVQQAVMGDRALASEAINRAGPRPRAAAYDTAAQFRQALVAAIAEVQAAGFRGIAVIAPNERAAADIHRLLDDRGVPHRWVNARTDPTPEQLTGTVVVPASLTKGLEFEAVILADAGEAAYPHDDPRAGRLVYVAVSRALHLLHVVSLGPCTAWLDGALLHADVTASARPRPARVALDRTRQALRRSLAAGVRTMRAERIPFRFMADDLAEAAERCLTEGRVTDLLDAYLQVGQIAPYSFNDLLAQLHGQATPERFLGYALACGAPARLDEEIDSALDLLRREDGDVASRLEARLERIRRAAHLPYGLPGDPGEPVERSGST
ncbi:UvrD-helicase domain-containing protein [Deinococcus sp. 6GRE01]|uniref:HelD family protein n=1 Tax=Deinococcus sp. 6GRE01 TaxID=2745873 RepID=UPI001E29B755|nr:UvrD-helicase domain-containing protein [Deinococcus sp. 6GRE01]MCD0155791.1 UvrD-helicase domain-containing protein [Deinococcus sp. 6GRE01]